MYIQTEEAWNTVSIAIHMIVVTTAVVHDAHVAVYGRPVYLIDLVVVTPLTDVQVVHHDNQIANYGHIWTTEMTTLYTR